MHIVDRRLNPGGKSFANRQRFLRRAKEVVQRAVRESSRDRTIKDLEQSGEVTIPADDIREPSFRRGSTGGHRDFVLPGNREYVEGDEIERPQGGGGGRGGGQAGQGGEDSEDEFRFVLSREEFLDLFLEDLELPDLAKRKLAVTEVKTMRRAGYTTTGSPANLALGRTLKVSLSRRIALKRPSTEAVGDLAAAIEALEREGGDPERLAALRAELETVERRRARIPYLDPLDLRYRRYEPHPKPIAQAVMFCLMDVSGSMTEHMKDLAKRFYMLLHIFLVRRYKHVEIVFIRHTDKAKEVDEETFFRGRETGGTLVSSALEEMIRIVRDRYSPSEWNIYAAQASDGDNMATDSELTATLLARGILPVCQYFAYVEVSEPEGHPLGFTAHGVTSLWRTYDMVRKSGGQFAMRKVARREEIYTVFRQLFQKRDATVGSSSP
ncbi:YeaH/YhbH family protein [Prosthecomicrobium sp. N25]|uniref:YeaH/YhbH family protein n=1 Tax=Prosthecomicrobium sp. N25 TaxID=3129254 RepID=UPI0030782AF1